MAKQSNYHNKNQQKLTREQRDNQVLGRVFRLFLLGIVAPPGGFFRQTASPAFSSAAGSAIIPLLKYPPRPPGQTGRSTVP